MNFSRGELLLLLGLAVLVAIAVLAVIASIERPRSLYGKLLGERDGGSADDAVLVVAVVSVVVLMFWGAVLLPHDLLGGHGELAGFEQADRSNLGAALVGSGLIGLAVLFMQSEISRRDKAQSNLERQEQMAAAQTGLLALFGRMVFESVERDRSVVDEIEEPVELRFLEEVQRELDAVTDADAELMPAHVQPEPWGAIAQLTSYLTGARMEPKPSADRFRFCASQLATIRKKGSDKTPLAGSNLEELAMLARNASDRTAALARISERAFLQSAAVHALPAVLRVQVATEGFTNSVTQVLAEAAEEGLATDGRIRWIAAMLENLCDSYAALFDVVNRVEETESKARILQS